jgi:hypothetical protein
MAFPITLTTGLEAIRQHCQCRLRFFLGEWFLDTSIGVPYFEDILIKNPSLPILNDIFKDQILETKGVLDFISFEMVFDTQSHTLQVQFSALTTDGVLDFSEEFNVLGDQ